MIYYVFQGKGRMTTYWLLGEKANPNSLDSESTQLQEASIQEPEQLLVSQQPNAPSITRELVEDTSIKIEDEKLPEQEAEHGTKKMQADSALNHQETTPLLSELSENTVVTNNTGNGSTHPL